LIWRSAISAQRNSRTSPNRSGSKWVQPPRQSPRRRPRRRKKLGRPRLSIVVLPFKNLSSDPGQDYFADGITENLTTDLSRIRNSFVIARNTAFTFKGKAIDARAEPARSADRLVPCTAGRCGTWPRAFRRSYRRIPQRDRLRLSRFPRVHKFGRRVCARWQDGRGEDRLGGSPPPQSQAYREMDDRTYAESPGGVRRPPQGGIAGGVKERNPPAFPGANVAVRLCVSRRALSKMPNHNHLAAKPPRHACRQMLGSGSWRRRASRGGPENRVYAVNQNINAGIS
jgi:hypothetical protein